MPSQCSCCICRTMLTIRFLHNGVAASPVHCMRIQLLQAGLKNDSNRRKVVLLQANVAHGLAANGVLQTVANAIGLLLQANAASAKSGVCATDNPASCACFCNSVIAWRACRRAWELCELVDRNCDLVRAGQLCGGGWCGCAQVSDKVGKW